jgi:hypothetical protein
MLKRFDTAPSAQWHAQPTNLQHRPQRRGTSHCVLKPLSQLQIDGRLEHAFLNSTT